MPINKQALRRYQIIDQCLRNKTRNFYINDLVNICNEKLQEIDASVTKRTIQYDLNDIEDIYGATIQRIKDGRRVYYKYEDPTFSITKNSMDEAELQELEKIVCELKKFEGVPMFDWVNEVKLRIDSKLNESYDNDISVEFENGYTDTNKLKFLDPIYNAIKERRILEVDGTSYSTGDYHKKVMPYFLKQYNCRWYLICHEKDSDLEFINIPIDRLVHVEPTNIKFEKSKDTDWQFYYDDVIGVTIPQGEDVETIELKADKGVLPYIKSRPLHGSQRVKGNIIKLEVIINYELKSKIRSFGSSIEVIAPEKLRKEIGEEYAIAAKKYNK